MGYNTENTVWPTSTKLPEATKGVIDRLFKLLDDSSEGVGDQIADEIFTSDGSMHGGAAKAEGTEALRHSRDKAWQLIQTRRHTVLRVYVHDTQGRDLLIIGHVTMGLPKNVEMAGEFTARIAFSADETDKDGNPKIKVYTVWADSAPLHKAIQEATGASK